MATANPAVKTENMETDTVKPPFSNNNEGGGGRGGGRGGPRRKRGGGGSGPPGPGRNFGGGGRGGHGQGGGQDKRNQFGGGGRQGLMNDFEGPSNKRMKFAGPEGRVLEKLRAIQGPTADLPPKQFEIKKFLSNTRLYIGNIANDATDEEVRELFSAYGEIDELFINREKNFAFLKLVS